MKPSPREFQEMRRMLAEHGYDPAEAVRLADEGMGSHEFAGRLRILHGEMGSLGYTHGIEPIHHSKPPKKWIQAALGTRRRCHATIGAHHRKRCRVEPLHKGELHRELHVPMGTKIPAAKLHAAAARGGALGKRARLALTLRKLRKRRR